jgi:hypothetical protein
LVWQGFISLSLANISYIKDVTQYKQGEKALLEAESLYRTIFEIAGTAMSVIQADGTTFGGKSCLSGLFYSLADFFLGVGAGSSSSSSPLDAFRNSRNDLPMTPPIWGNFPTPKMIRTIISISPISHGPKRNGIFPSLEIP